MCPATPLAPGSLRRCCDPAEIPFGTTDEVGDFDEVIGQDRAVEAVRFGVTIRGEGYNLFAIGPHGTGKQSLLERHLRQKASGDPTPADWCYVHDFEEPHRARALKLPPGTGIRLREDMERLVTELRASMRAEFDGEEYRTRKQQIVKSFKERQDRAFASVQERAKKEHVAVVRTDTGVILAPLRDGEILEPDRFQELSEDERNHMQEAMERAKEELSSVFREAHEAERQEREAVNALDREYAAMVARRRVDEVRARHRSLADVIEYLSQVEHDVVENADDFRAEPEEGLEATLRRAFRRGRPDGPSFTRYEVNVLVDNAKTKGAPVICEDNPSYSNLVGRVEHVAEFGALVTDFTLVKAGSLHRASGGYLLLEAIKVLQQPYAWDALKRAIGSGEVRIESIGQLLGLTTTASVEPEPIPLEGCKVVLVGERILYYLLAALDPDFLELFKVLVDFEDTTERQPETLALYSRVIAMLARKEGLRPFDRGAVARVLEHAARLAGDAERLSLQMRRVVDLLREADVWAAHEGRAVTTAADVDVAIEAQQRRAGRVRERVLDEIQRETIRIETTGERVGQVNGLSVVQLGEYRFGYPTRITARVRVGKGEVLDIEREVELGGPVHSKGVLILGGFLGAKYASRAPLSLTASLVFEQSYGPVEGDSASLAELCALLSALSNVPIAQSFAVTGSIDQHGQVQAIGGVNEKVEGFFDACAARGFTGDQAVLIPRSNMKHLMLRQDIVEAVERERFRVFSVDGVDEAMELLTGRPAAKVNELVESRLTTFAEDASAFLRRPLP